MSSIQKFFFGRTQEPVKLAQSLAQTNCCNCGEELRGPYCSNCGQKKEHRHDVTVSHFIGHTFHEFTHFDSRFFRSFRYLLFKPGYLTEQFLAGHRKKYINPIRLFIIVNIIYFVVVYITGFSMFSTPLEYQVTGPGKRQQKEMVDNRIRELGIPYETYEKQFNHYTIGMAKSLVVIMVPMFALLTSLLFYKQKRFAVEHLVFSLEVYSMIMIFLSVGMYVVLYSSQIVLFLGDKLLTMVNVIDNVSAKRNMQFLRSLFNDVYLSVLMVLVGSGLLFLSLRRVFRQSVFLTFIKTIISVVGIFFIVAAYRLILFYATFYTLHIP